MQIQAGSQTLLWGGGGGLSNWSNFGTYYD